MPATAPAWTGTFCPMLTAAEASRRAEEASRILQAGIAKNAPAAKEAIACQGPSCALFCKTPGPDGVDKGEGRCSIALVPQLLNTQVMVMGALVERLAGAFGAPPLPAKPQ